MSGSSGRAARARWYRSTASPYRSTLHPLVRQVVVRVGVVRVERERAAVLGLGVERPPQRVERDAAARVRVGELRVERERAVVARRARAPARRACAARRRAATARARSPGRSADRALELGLRLGEPARVQERGPGSVAGEPGALGARERPVHGERRGEPRQYERRGGPRARRRAAPRRARAHPPRRAASAPARAGSGSARTRRTRRRSPRARAPSPAGARAAARPGAPRACRPARAAPTHRSGTARTATRSSQRLLRVRLDALRVGQLARVPDVNRPL